MVENYVVCSLGRCNFLNNRRKNHRKNETFFAMAVFVDFDYIIFLVAIQ